MTPLPSLALPGHFDVRGQREASLAVWAQDWRDEAGEEMTDDGLPHGGQAG